MNKECTLGFMIGLGFGIGTALLFAPKSGKQTRSLMSNKAREGAGYLQRQAEELRDSAVAVVDEVREEGRRQKENLKRAAEAGVQAYQEKLAQG